MRFVFKLQALLNWKKNLEELSQMRLADKLKYLQTQEEEIQNLRNRRSAYAQEMNEKSLRGLKAGEYLTYQQYFEESYKDLILKEEKKKHTIREIEMEREKLIAFTKQRKILEKLKEKKLERFRYQSEREEQIKNDERAIRRYQSPPKVNFS
ncbi:MAG: flagellar export protein FliJ [Thermodesulfobacteriota bacterium]|jgi:flagellar FliJ protein